MKLIAILFAGVGIMGSAVVQAQQTGQGSAVPRQPILVAQAPGTFTAPGAVQGAVPAAVAGGGAVMVGFGFGLAGIFAAGNSNSTVSH